MNKIAPSILAADFNILGEQIAEVERAGADYLHIDVMDGRFVPSISFGMPLITSIRKNTDIFFDCHLMIEEPERYLKDFADAGADGITVHVEACSDTAAALDRIHSLGLRAGLSLDPETPAEAVAPYLDKADMILVMSVHPGFGGQKFIPSSKEKIRLIKEMCIERGLDTDIEVDGGITAENLKEVIDSGANVIVSGSSIFKGSISDNIKKFREIMK